MVSKKPSRRTLAQVGTTPTPAQLYDRLMKREGWPYQTDDKELLHLYRTRDRALPSILYVGELRISEALRITLGQFELTEEALVCHEVIVSKTRKPTFREVKFPLSGERACFTELIQAYLDLLHDMDCKPDRRLFPWSLEVKRLRVRGHDYHWRRENKVTPRFSVQMVGTRRAWQIVNALLPELTQHWLRVYGEKYLLHEYGKVFNPAEAVLAVSKTVKVDPRTAMKYLLAGTEEVPIV